MRRRIDRAGNAFSGQSRLRHSSFFRNSQPSPSLFHLDLVRFQDCVHLSSVSVIVLLVALSCESNDHASGLVGNEREDGSEVTLRLGVNFYGVIVD